MIKIFINDVPRDLSISFGDVVNISELDQVLFQFDFEGNPPKAYIEDYELHLERKNNSFSSEKYQFFRESFGISYLRIYHGDQIFEYAFNVLAEKVTCDQAESIIEYVYTKNPNLLKVSFSRTTIEKSLVKDESTHFESFLDFSQSLVNYLDSKKLFINRLIKKKFISQKTVVNNGTNKNIDPEEVLFNLDKIYHDNTSSDILINRNYYSASGLPSISLKDTYDFKENQIILAGLIYTKINLNKILEVLDGIDLVETSNSDKEYYSFKKSEFYRRDISKVILKVTSTGILKRVLFLLKEIEYYIYFFEKKCNVSYNGPIYPKITKVTIANSFYKEIFGKIRYIYECGSFGLNDIVAKIKIRSMSKIYEFFCLYKLINCFERIGFTLVEEIKDGDIPKEIKLERDNKIVCIFYEKIIQYIGAYPMDKSDLVSVNYDHSHAKKYDYYNPDFVVSIEDKMTLNKVYYILDAKFRNLHLMQKDKTLEKIKFKYFDNIKYFNIRNKTLSNRSILGNFILYQGKKSASLFENIHLRNFKTLPLFEILPLYNDLNDSFVEDLILFSE